MTICRVVRLGTIEYQKAWNLQNQLAEMIARGEQPPMLLLLEHSHTYTFGRRGQEANLLWDEAELARREIAVHWIDRGGDVTYHGPGQLVGYPLLPLGEAGLQVDAQTGKARLPEIDYVGYLRKLEKVIVDALAGLGLATGTIDGQTGVWMQGHVPSRCPKCPPELFEAPAKLASIGVKVDAKGVTRHGFALNVNPDMSYWKGIIACGLDNQNQASLEYFLDPPPKMDEVVAAVVETFGRVFGYEMKLEAGVLLL